MRAVTEADHQGSHSSGYWIRSRCEPERTLSLGDMADIAALSPFHAVRVFRAITGYTPAAIQTAVRVQEAKRLLVAEGSSVTDACYAVGFSKSRQLQPAIYDADRCQPKRIPHRDRAMQMSWPTIWPARTTAAITHARTPYRQRPDHRRQRAGRLLLRRASSRRDHPKDDPCAEISSMPPATS